MTPYHFCYVYILQSVRFAHEAYISFTKDLRKRLIDHNEGGKGFTLIETLVAVTLLSIAVVAPMTLTAKSLAAAYYSRDRIAAFNLAQEGIETVRHVRDNNILQTVKGTPTDTFAGILPVGQTTHLFIIDTLDDEIQTCPSEGCIPLQLDPTQTFYGYGGVGWTTTIFTRSIQATVVRSDAGVPQEIQVSVTIRWRSNAFQTPRTVTIAENLYRWVSDT